MLDLPSYLDALQNAVTDLRHVLRGDLSGLLHGSEGVANVVRLDDYRARRPGAAPTAARPMIVTP